MVKIVKSKVRVLIVDDDLMICNLVKMQLQRFGYQVCGIANNGSEAVELTAELQPDLLLLDLQMPSSRVTGEEHFAGLNVAKQIRKTSSVPIILLTAHESPETIDRASAIGVDNYLVKPAPPNDLDRAIVMALAHSEADEALRRSEEQHRQLVEFLPVGVLILDREGQVLFTNSATANLAGVSDSVDLLGEQFIARLPFKLRELVSQRLQQVAEGATLTNFELEIKLSAEQTRPVLVDAIPYTYREKPTILLTLRDITARKEWEVERQSLYQRTNSLYQVSRTLATFQRQPLPVQLNQITRSVAAALPAARVTLCTVDLQARRITHLSRAGEGSENISIPSFDVLMKGLSGWALRHLQPILSPKGRPDPRESQAHQQERLATQGGSIIISPLLYQDEPLGTLTAINLIDQRDFNGSDLARLTAMGSQIGIALKNALLAQQMADLKKFNENIVRSVGEAILLENEQGEITFTNPAATNLWGYSHAELLECTSDELLREKQSPRDAKGYVTRYETQVIDKAGVSVPAIVSSRPLSQADGFRGILSVITDITERKQAEKQLQQYAAELESQNAELDAFAHTVAHDLKNPLSVLLGYAELLKLLVSDGTNDEATLLKNISHVVRGGKQLVNIIDELLLLSSIRSDEIPLASLDMAEILDIVKERLEVQIIDKDAELTIQRTWPSALGHGPWIEEVWINYLSNALKYGGPSPRIELGGVRNSNRTARFWVRDSGPGIAPEDQGHLFTPFERLNQLQIEGHGLGLSIVERIINKLGGEVGVESVLGEGSTFYFTLPTVPAE